MKCGPAPMDLGNVGTHDAKMTQSHATTRVRPLGKGTKPAREQARRDQTDRGHCTGSDQWTSGRRDDGGKEARAANLNCAVTRTEEALEATANAKVKVFARVKPDTATIAESKSTSW